MVPNRSRPLVFEKKIEYSLQPYNYTTMSSLVNETSTTIYNDDKCLGMKAPSLATLEVMHWPEGVEPSTEIKYADKKATVICFWAKTHKGNYPTICTWSDMQELERFKDTVQFVGVARDMDQANVTKYMSKIGEFKAELGAHGITISGGIPLAYDPGFQVNMGFKKCTIFKSLGVDNAFIVDAEGVIQWRCLFNRGAEPSGQFMTQLEHVVKGEPIDLLNDPPEEDMTPAVEEAADPEAAAGIASLICDY